ncbi:MAG: Ig-like domain-containing protein, partial [Ignavibacteria bacterium]|nr:Ig-like domain-containing protein [Ignavibacteria bacterium]
GAVRVQENIILLEFSEYVDRRSVEDAIFISPPVGDVEYDWSGKDLEILLPDTLRSNTTYVVTVGTDVIDQRAKNRMATGHTLAFSTGDSLDRGRMSGRVYDPKPEAVTLFAYRLDPLDADTLDPARVKPDYIMQTGRDGRFVFSSLAWGTYRLFAIRDEYRNLLYDRQLDQFGVFNRDIVLSADNPSVDIVQFQLTKEDTTNPFLSGVQPLDERQIRFRFSEPVRAPSFDLNNVSVVDTAVGESVPLRAAFLDPLDRSAGGILFGVPLTHNAVYRLSVTDVSDTAGWPIDPMNASLTFRASENPDTVAPVFSVISFADTILGFPVDRPMTFAFDEPVNRSVFANGLTISDTGGGTVSLMPEWISPVKVQVRPAEKFRFARTYHLQIVMDSVIDLNGNARKDSVWGARFTTFNPDRSGELEGVTQDLNLSAAGPVVVTVRRISDRKESALVQDSPGKFHFPELAAGHFVVTAYRDEDSSGAYTFGLPFPFHPSERFVVGSDTVKVRPRWSVEGVSLIIP